MKFCKKIPFILTIFLTNCSDSSKYFQGQASEMADAIENEDLIKMEKLVKYDKLNLNSVGNEGMTFLIWSFYTGEKKSMKKLLELGANPNIETSLTSPNYKMFKKSYPDSIFTVQSTVLGEVVHNMKKDFEWIDILANHGTDLCNSKYGNALVFEEVLLHQKYNIMFYLIEKGADINCRANFGYTMAIQCAKNGRFDIVCKLLEKGADLTLYGKSERFMYNKDMTAMEWIPYKEDIADIIQRWDGNYEPQLPYRKKIKNYLRSKGYKFPKLEQWEINAGATESYEKRFN